MLRPDVQGLAHTVSHVRISWGKDPAVEEVAGDTMDWSASASVYGIVGVLRLFHGMYVAMPFCTYIFYCRVHESIIPAGHHIAYRGWRPCVLPVLVASLLLT